MSVASVSALRLLQQVNFDLDRSVQRAVTGLRVNSAKDDPVVWKKAAFLRSDLRSSAAVRNGLEETQAALAVNATALTSTRALLDEMKTLLTRAKTGGSDMAALQAGWADLRAGLRATAAAASRPGFALLSTDTSAPGYDPRRTVVTGLATSPTGQTRFQTSKIDTRLTQLIDEGTARSGILQRPIDLPAGQVRTDLAGLSGTATETAGRSFAAPSTTGISGPVQATDGLDAVAPATAGLDGAATSVEGAAARTPSTAGLSGASTNAVSGVAGQAARAAEAVVGRLNTTSNGLRSGDTIELQTSVNGTARTVKVYLRSVGDAATLQSELQRALNAEFGNNVLVANVASDRTISVRSATAGPGSVSVTGMQVVDGDDVTTSTLDLQSQSGWSTTSKQINGANHVYDSIGAPDLSRIDRSDRLRFTFNIRDPNGNVLRHSITVGLAGVSSGGSLASAIDQVIANDTSAGRPWRDYVGAHWDGTNVLFYQRNFDNAIAVTQIEALNGDGSVADNIGFATGSGSGAAATSGQAASVRTGSDFAGPVTLGEGASLTLDVLVNGTARPIAVTKATIEAALAGQSGYTAGSGTIGTVDQFARVAQQAVSQAGISNVSVAAVGARLQFTRTGAPADGDSLDVRNAAATASNAVRAALTTGSDFAGPVTIATNAALRFDLTVDGAVRSVELTAGDVETALGARAGYTAGSGRIGSAADLALVVKAALARQSISGIEVDASGARLVFSKAAAGPGSLALSNVVGQATATIARASLDFTAPVTVEAGASLAWSFAVNGAQRSVDIRHSTVEAALSGTSGYTAGSGTIGSAEQMAAVLQRAFAEAGISDLAASAANGRIEIARTLAGAASVSIGAASGTAKPGSAATAVTGTAFGSQLSLRAGQSVRFDLTVDSSAARTITIDAAVVEAALSGRAGYTAGSGTIASADDLASVVAEALRREGVSGVSVRSEGERLLFAKTAAGTGSIGIGNVRLEGVTQSAGRTTIDTIDLSGADMAQMTAPQRGALLDALIAGVEARKRDVTGAEAYLATFSNRLAVQSTFLSNLETVMTRRLGLLVDVNLEEEAARQKALVVRRDLALQALQIANQTKQNVLLLFR